MTYLFFNNKWLDEYDQILYVDTDVFAFDHAPDIFNHNLGIKSFIEVGPGKVLQGLNKRIDRSLKCDTIGSLQQLESIFV